MSKIIVSALAAVSLTVTIPVHAEDASIDVQYSDLDLTTALGIERLNGRIKAAIDRVCGQPVVRDVKVAASQKKCREQAAQAAFAEVARAIEEKNGVALSSMLQENRPG